MIGRTCGKYKIVKRLGQGGMAEVYLASQAILDRYVALKFIKTTAADHPEERLRLFEREAKSAAALRHPNIVQLYDFDVDAETGQPYIVMEFIEGEPLEQYVVEREAHGSPLSLAEIESIMSDMCAALAYAHRNGMVHRDVKLANIMRDKDGRHILNDFGLAKLAAGPSITASGVFGTPDYMSPEQIMSREVDGRTDLYALGVILYRLLTGRMPYTGDTAAGVILGHVNTPVPDPRSVKPDLPASLTRCVMKSLAKSPDDRFQTADEFLAELSRAIVGQAPPSQPPAEVGLPSALDTPVLPSLAPFASPALQMHQDESPWDSGVIRQLLNEAFDDDEITDVCFDYFRPVHDKFAEGMDKSDKIRRLLAYCLRQNQVEQLLDTVQKLNPAQYERFKPRLRREGAQLPTPTPYVEGQPPASKPSALPSSRPVTPSGAPIQLPPAPFQAPSSVAWFVGREEELKDICEILTRATGNNVVCITGMGGIGKTVFAARIAHRVRQHYTDGLLWGNAFTSEPLAILESWARAYQCDFSGLPDLDSRAAAMRNVLADKRVLIVLDDVWNADKVRPLFPGSPQSVVLMTSRDLEVAAALNAIVYPLETLSPLESCQLMSRILGEERVMAEKDVADDICRLLMHLPLAVEIAAQRLASRKRWRLADLAERLREEHNRLNELQVGNRQVRASFAVSWAALDENLRKSFASSAVFEGRAFTAQALAAVAEMDPRTARDCLDALIALSLMKEEGKAHYHQHPLLADFACEQLEQQEAAYARMAQYYLKFAQDHRNNYAELEQEWNNLGAGIQVAYQQQMWQVVIDYTDALKDMWFARGRYTDARQAYAWASEAAHELGNRHALAASLLHWGQACIEQNDYVEAKEHLSQTLQNCEELDDLPGVASAQYYLGRIASEEADYDEAQRLLVASRRIREQLGDAAGVAAILYRQANISFYHSAHEEAERLGERALEMQQAAGDKLGCVRTLGLLADVAQRQNQLDVAERHCRHALRLCEEIHEEGELAISLYILSDVCRLQGNLETAREHAEKSLELLKRMGDRKSQARALYQLSQVDADRHEYAVALQEGLASLNLCRELNDTWGTVHVLRHLGDIVKSLGQIDRAREMWSEGLRLAEELQHPQGEALRERLTQ